MKDRIEIRLRNWARKDFPIVKNILITTWKDAYKFIPEEDILQHYEKFYSSKEMEKLFCNEYVEGIIAEANSNPAGWMKLYEFVEGNRFYISSLYILPQYQGIGLGKKLLSKAFDTAKKKNYDNIWLGVMKQNSKALEWYKNQGFIFIEEEPFQMGKKNVLHLIGYKSLL